MARNAVKHYFKDRSDSKPDGGMKINIYLLLHLWLSVNISQHSDV